MAEQADIDPAEDLPDGADDVPGDEQRQGHADQADRHAPAFFRHGESNGDAERHLDQQDDAGKQQLLEKGGMKAFGMDEFPEPVHADPGKDVVAEGVLDRIVDDGHQRDDGAEGDHEKDGQDHEPGLLIGLFCDHSGSPVTRWSLT